MASASVVVESGRRRTRIFRSLGGFGLLVAITALVGCDSPHLRQPSPPRTSLAPYQAVVAVAPFANESGVSIPPQKQLQVGDGIVTAINQGKGWKAVPLNRTIQAMRQLGMSRVDTLDGAVALIKQMGVDAIILGTITDWSPYDPPRFGANAIFVAGDLVMETTFDARTSEGSTREVVVEDTLPPQPIAQVVGVYDAADHGNAIRLREYAAGRYDLNGGFDPPERYYLMVFRRYVEYATWCLVEDLIQNERARIAGANQQANAQQ
ncbi:MAG: hypothetical protein MK085_00050 [Phycisphaerales bacterium]|nr:hypothetical protein [Phycisphaerales bacterium]